ncbi:MAG: FAD-dependent oxidoreductase [Candidatus Omnitrophota bacterium]
MKKIVIIGNSAAGIAAAEAIRELDRDSELAIVSGEPFFLYDRRRLLDLVASTIKEKELFLKNEDFYETHGIELLREREAVGVNFERKRIFFKTKGFLDFDSLIVATGMSVKLPSLKGIHKQGVVALNGLNDIKFILENLPIAHTVIVVGDNELASQVARIITERKFEVKLIGKRDMPLEGVDIIGEAVVTEILGDADVKAVRLSNNKVIGASLVIFTGPRTPNVDFLKETPIKINKGILVDEAMRTNVPFVFAAGDAIEFLDRDKILGWGHAVEEARVAARVLCQMQPDN